ncbi:MAG: sulfatase-like hydrolase/transferase, partial [Myxococcales bacterium]|nr:sulfatase-like hydrolase/transferase [Myxococcales bacterium]
MDRKPPASVIGPLLPPLVGAAYLVPIALWAVQSPTVDEREGGSQARQIDAVVHGHFAGEIARMGVAIVAAALVIGALLGWAAALLVALRDRIGAPRPSAPRSLARQAVLLLAVVVGLHAVLTLWAMAQDPQLYAGAWYESGGLRRTVQVLATDVLGPPGVVRLGLLASVVFLAGPVSGWRRWPERASHAAERIAARLAHLAPGSWESRRVVALCASIGCAATLAALAVTHTPSASARAATDPRPNVLVLAADSLRADRIDPRIAPHLTALAARGTTFERAYVSLPRTFPSWVTLLTGRHPHHHGIRSMFPRWEERTRDFDALPERLSRAGWATGAVSDYAGDIFSRVDLGFGTIDVPQFDFRQLIRQRALERETPLLPVLNSRVGRAA